MYCDLPQTGPHSRSGRELCPASGSLTPPLPLPPTPAAKNHLIKVMFA